MSSEEWAVKVERRPDTLVRHRKGADVRIRSLAGLSTIDSTSPPRERAVQALGRVLDGYKNVDRTVGTEVVAANPQWFGTQ